MSGRGVKGSSMEHQNARGRSRGRGSQRARGRGRCASFNEGQTPGRTAQKTQSQSAGSATTGADRRTEERAGLAARRDHPLEGEHKVEKKEEKPQKLIRDDDPVLPSVKPKENHLSQPILTGEARLEETNCIPRKHQLSNPVQELENLSIKGKGSTSSSAKPAGQIQDFRPVRRPQHGGTSGRQIRLRANFYPVRFRGGDAYHYDVDIDPTNAPKRIKRGIINQIVQEYAVFFKTEKPVFDGQKNLFTKNPLPIRNQKEVMKVVYKDNPEDKGREYTVTVQYAARVSLDMLQNAFRGKGEIQQEALQVIDIVLRNLLSCRYVPVGRSLFSQPKGDICHLGDGREVWFGHYQSVRPTQWEMMLNINTVATAFYKTQPVLDFACELFNLRDRRELRPLRDSERKKLEKELKGLNVQYTYIKGQKRKKRVKGVGKLSPDKQKFWNEDKKREVTVSEYFRDAYKIRLEYPFLPCMELGAEKSFVHVPLELLTLVPGQRCIKKLNEAQTAQMIRATARSAPDKKFDIQNIMKDAQFHRDEFARHFGIEVSQEMVKIQGRVLDAPAIEYKSDRSNNARVEQPSQGKWDMRNQQFLSGVHVKNWALLNFSRRRLNVERFCEQLCSVAGKSGLFIETLKFLRDSYGISVKEAFDEAKRNIPDIQLIIAIVPGTSEIYNEVKKLGDTQYGIPTQCVHEKNVDKANPQLLVNISMKINAKLGGINNKVLKVHKPKRVFESPVIILGADVTHPSAHDTSKPSIAAVVGSLDAGPTKYCAKVRVQKHRQEIIADLKNVVVELLRTFYTETKYKPRKIIMYRDGVGEGQFQQVLNFELQAIREACLSLDKEYRPAITFLTVQKRHHIRLFAEDRKDQIGKSGNVPAGTTVDTVICHPVNFDFYLCSHAGIQGTSRPAHYQVLWDDSNFTPDELQQLTYVLCHTYARCTRSVSIPAPAYYAHHVAFRARAHTDERNGDSESSSNGKTDVEREILTKALEDAVMLHANMQKTMYFV